MSFACISKCSRQPFTIPPSIGKWFSYFDRLRFQAWFIIRGMCVTTPEISAGEVLSAFHRDAPYLFLGAAFVAVGLVSAALAAIRRKYDALLIYFALFAAFYGLRLWIQSSLLRTM